MGISLGLVGLGQFGGEFAPLFLNHPLVDRIALCDIEPERVKREFKNLGGESAKLSEKDCCTSLDEILETDVDAVVVITQQWLHSKHSLKALEAGKSVWSAVPLLQIPDTDEILEDCDKLVRAVQRTGQHYFLAETTYFRPETMFCRRQARAGAFGAFVYAEGEYNHSFDNPHCDLRKVMAGRFTGESGIAWKNQLDGYLKRCPEMGPMLYPTHSLSGPLSIMNARPVKVSCFGQRPITSDPYFKNVGELFSNQTALYQLDNGATMRICEHRETALDRDSFRLTGTDAYYTQTGYWHDFRDSSRSRNFSNEEMRDPLPDDVMDAFLSIHEIDRSTMENDFTGIFRAHGGSHPYMVHEFVSSVAEDRVPAVSIWEAARWAAAGVTAHLSALKGGECLDIPDFGTAPREAKLFNETALAGVHA